MKAMEWQRQTTLKFTRGMGIYHKNANRTTDDQLAAAETHPGLELRDAGDDRCAQSILLQKTNHASEFSLTGPQVKLCAEVQLTPAITDLYDGLMASVIEISVIHDAPYTDVSAIAIRYTAKKHLVATGQA
jgi:hypothetical protein